MHTFMISYVINIGKSRAHAPKLDQQMKLPTGLD